MFAALLDTCVLWPNLQRDFLLSMAVEGLYRPLWSEAILEELHRHEQLKLIDRDTDADQALADANHLIGQMRSYFDDALVVGWEALEGSYGLPDPNDEHVVAAAVVGGAGAIVTNNLKHFPTDKVPSNINVVTGRDFVEDTADVNPESAVRALMSISARYTRTEYSPRDLLTLMVDRYEMRNLEEILAGALDEAAIQPAGN